MTNERFADGIVPSATSSGKLQEIVTKPTKMSTDAGLQINTKKIKVMKNSVKTEIRLKGRMS
jgi:hypothetical protein